MPFTEGHQVIYNDDGSTTYITIEHEPYTEPMSKAATILWTTGLTLFSAAVVGAPIWVTILEERHSKQKALADRQKKNKEIFRQLKPN